MSYCILELILVILCHHLASLLLFFFFVCVCVCVQETKGQQEKEGQQVKGVNVDLQERKGTLVQGEKKAAQAH